MEGREQPLSDGNGPSFWQKTRTKSLGECEFHHHQPPFPVTASAITSDEPVFGSGTYIVQVPKDQIYRIPPPENANRFRVSSQERDGRRSCSLCSFILIFVTVLFVAIVASVIGIFLNHDDHGLSIDHFHVKRPPSGRQKQRLEYDIRLKFENPNKYHGISYSLDTNATLSFKQKEIADGKFPDFHQGPKESTDVTVVLHGSKTLLPKEVAKSKNSRISLSLSMNVQVKLKIGALNVKSKKIGISCSFMVDKLDKNARILSQKCGTNG